MVGCACAVSNAAPGSAVRCPPDTASDGALLPPTVLAQTLVDHRRNKFSAVQVRNLTSATSSGRAASRTVLLAIISTSEAHALAPTSNGIRYDRKPSRRGLWVADLCCAGFKVLGNLVIILRDATKQGF
jgi:hypothetical protein